MFSEKVPGSNGENGGTNMDTKKLAGKTAIITGATGGAGSAITRLFTDEGAKVVIAARVQKAGEALRDEVLAKGGEAIFVPTDVASEESVVNCVNKCMETFGAVDILVNIACIMSLDTGYLHECSAEDFDKDIAINLKGAFLFCKHVLPIMVKEGRGWIVNFSSIGGYKGILGHTVYGAAKAGVESMTRSIMAQYGKQGIHCNCIRPGVMTNDHWAPEAKPYADFMLTHIPVQRIGTGADSAPLALFLCCDDSYYINGQVITLDGGMTEHQPQWKEDMAPENANAMR